jgi:hypothetical protein
MRSLRLAAIALIGAACTMEDQPKWYAFGTDKESGKLAWMWTDPYRARQDCLYRTGYKMDNGKELNDYQRPFGCAFKSDYKFFALAVNAFYNWNFMECLVLAEIGHSPDQNRPLEELK